MKVQPAHDRDNSEGITGWQKIAALFILALVVVITLLITHTADAVSVAVAPLLLVLGITLM
jgi:hypothetical protein